MKSLTRPSIRDLQDRVARHSHITHLVEQTVANLLCVIVVGAACVVLFS